MGSVEAFEFAEYERRSDTLLAPRSAIRGRRIQMRLAARAPPPPSVGFEGLVQLWAIEKSQIDDSSFHCFINANIIYLRVSAGIGLYQLVLEVLLI